MSTLKKQPPHVSVDGGSVVKGTEESEMSKEIDELKVAKSREGGEPGVFMETVASDEELD